MEPTSPSRRAPLRLSDSVHRQLNMYALAAGAAGLGVLSLAQPAEAKIVYTKTHRVLGPNQYYNLDLNHDGIVDFILSNYATYVEEVLVRRLVEGNGAAGSGRYPNYAYAMPAGKKIGPALPFKGILLAGYDSKIQSSRGSGYWVNVKNRYLGLKFKIKGKTHYGWARLSVKLVLHQGDHSLTPTLTGYAYETVPHKPIIAGKTEGPDEVTVKPGTASGSLGRLALGRK